MHTTAGAHSAGPLGLLNETSSDLAEPESPLRPRDLATIPLACPTMPTAALNVASINMNGAGRVAARYQQERRNAAPGGYAHADPDHRYQETASRTTKLAQLTTLLRRNELDRPLEAADIACLQEFSTTDNPATLLETRIREYQTFAATPGSANDFARPVVDPTANARSRAHTLAAAERHDTAILVHKRLGEAHLQAAVSCPRATFVTVPARGLLLVSIHGPFNNITVFHDDIIATIRRYIDAGWIPIIAGDFNVAPFPGDRATSSDRSSLLDHGRIIPAYERLLDVRDYAHLTAPPPPAHGPPYSTSNPRRSLFTHKENNGVNVLAGTYTARVDVILVPLSLLTRPGITYESLDHGSFSDHKEIRVCIPASAEAITAKRQKRQFVLAHDQCSNDEMKVTIEAILGKYESYGMFEKAPTAEHFTYYFELLDEVRAAGERHNKRHQRTLRADIIKLYRKHARLFNENGGRNRDIHREELECLESLANELTLTAAVDTQRRAAALWIRNGDNNSRWQSMVAKQNLAPRTKQYIERLRAHLPGADTPDTPTATGSAGLLDAAHDYYSDMYCAAEPIQPRLASLLEIHKAEVGERMRAFNRPPFVSTHKFQPKEVKKLTEVASRRKACGPNGIPAELYIHSRTARRILCHLANIWIKSPHLVPPRFADGSIAIIFKNKGSPESLDNYRPISLLNADLKIITSMLSKRIAHLVEPAIAPEQHAIIPGRFINNALYTIQAAVQYLDKTSTEAVIVFLDQAKAFDRISHTALFAVLRNLSVPEMYIAAIRRLYAISNSAILVNGDSTDPFPIARGVRQGDALSCVLFVVAAELLGCALRYYIRGPVRANIPILPTTHMLYMDDTAVFMNSLKDWPVLQQALDWYCDATTAKFNESKTEILNFAPPAAAGAPPVQLPAYLPVSPLPEGHTLRYLGIRLGARVKVATRNAERQAQIDIIVAAATTAMRGQHTMAGRAFALTTFVIPRFQFIFRFESFSMEMIHDTDKRIRRAFWGRIGGFLAHPQSALPRNEGGYGLPSLPSIYRATRLNQVALFTNYVARRLQPQTPPSAPLTRLDWPDMYIALWHMAILRRSSSPFVPKPLRDLAPQHLPRILFDPFSQHMSWANLPLDAWPPAWQEAHAVCHKHQQFRVDLAHTLEEGSSLMRPALGHPHSVLDLFIGGSTEYNIFFRILSEMYPPTTPFGEPPMFTVAQIMDISNKVRGLAQYLEPGQDRHIQMSMASELKRYYLRHCPTPEARSEASLSRLYTLNWAYGDKRLPSSPSPDAVTVYCYLDIPEPSLDPTEELPMAPLPATPETASEAESEAEPEAEPNAPEPLAIPYELWSYHGTVRKMLDAAPPLTYPTITLSGGGYALPKYSETKTPWKAIRKLHATPQARNTIHRLSINRIPRRQGDYPKTCHCLAPETVVHLTGRCKDFDPFRGMFCDNWTELAHAILPTVRRELEDAAVEAARLATAAQQELADEVAAAEGTIPRLVPAVRPKPVKIARLPRERPNLSNWAALPLLSWPVFSSPFSKTAKQFMQLYQLAAALLIHILWVARNDNAYSAERWSRKRFMDTYNYRLRSDAQATLPSQSAVIHHFDLAPLYMQDPDSDPDGRPAQPDAFVQAPRIPPRPWHRIRGFPEWRTLGELYTFLARSGIVSFQPP